MSDAQNQAGNSENQELVIQYLRSNDFRLVKPDSFALTRSGVEGQQLLTLYALTHEVRNVSETLSLSPASGDEVISGTGGDQSQAQPQVSTRVQQRHTKTEEVGVRLTGQQAAQLAGLLIRQLGRDQWNALKAEMDAN